MPAKHEPGTAVLKHEITPADLDGFILNLGFPRFAPAPRRHVQSLIRSAVKRIDILEGLQRKQIGDVIAEQAGSLATAAAMEIAIPERDAIILNRA